MDEPRAGALSPLERIEWLERTLLWGDDRLREVRARRQREAESFWAATEPAD